VFCIASVPPRSGLPINTRWSLVISTQPSLRMPNGREAHRDGDGRTAPLGHIASRWSGGVPRFTHQIPQKPERFRFARRARGPRHLKIRKLSPSSLPGVHSQKFFNLVFSLSA